MVNLAVLFENQQILVVNKPPGLVVNRAESVKTETITDIIEASGKISLTPVIQSAEYDEFRMRAGIVHRLDKDTSGILIVGKTPDAYCFLKQQFADRSVEKTYLAIVHGDLSPPEGVIDAPVGRLPWNRERFGIVPDGKPAVTVYRRIIGFAISNEKLSFVALKPKTGRTHQIRVHMKHIRHPLVGDRAYAGRKTSRRDFGLVSRIMLHAYQVRLILPDERRTEKFTAPVPQDMRNFLVNGGVTEEIINTI